MLSSILYTFAIFSSALGSPSAEPAAAGGSVCSQKPYNLILPFSNYPPAESFCSSKYPVKPSTSTTTTIPVTTVTTTATSTDHTTETDTTTTTVTETATTVTKKKRDATQSSKWKSCQSTLSKSGNVLSTACSCIETPITSTVTRTGKKSTATITSTAHTTVTDTTTTIETATTTVQPPPAPSCPSGVRNVCCSNFYSNSDVCVGFSDASQNVNGDYSCSMGTYLCCPDGAALGCSDVRGNCFDCYYPS